MSNAVLSIVGSIHKGHEQFSDISRGRKCSFTSFSALLCAQSDLVRHWHSATVDHILIKSQSIPETQTLPLSYLPNQTRRVVQSPIDITKSQATRFKPVEANSSRQSLVVANNSIYFFHIDNVDHSHYNVLLLLP